MRSGTRYAFYAPRRQMDQLNGTFVLRTDVDPASIVSGIRDRVRSLNPAIAIVSIEPLSALMADEIAGERYRARLTFVFAALAAVFSIMGVYGVTARGVAARRREMGIRVALGETRGSVFSGVVMDAARLAAVGGIAGIVIAFFATRWLEAYLWGVERTDPATLVAIGLFLGGASVIAATAPGLRAARVDPAETLRTD
jgi:ABC-type antimicrobial peptide transport system permease subunit